MPSSAFLFCKWISHIVITPMRYNFTLKAARRKMITKPLPCNGIIIMNVALDKAFVISINYSFWKQKHLLRKKTRIENVI